MKFNSDFKGLRLVALRSSEEPVTVYQSTEHNIREDFNLKNNVH